MRLRKQLDAQQGSTGPVKATTQCPDTEQGVQGFIGSVPGICSGGGGGVSQLLLGSALSVLSVGLRSFTSFQLPTRGRLQPKVPMIPVGPGGRRYLGAAQASPEKRRQTCMLCQPCGGRGSCVCVDVASKEPQHRLRLCGPEEHGWLFGP